MNTPGLKIVCRQTYDTGGPSFDHPLTRRFDEGDALAIFDNVLVPWERVFAARDLETYNMIRPSLPGYLWLQAVIRSTSKLRFMTGLATLVGQAVGRHDLPRYQEMVGELVGNVEIAEGLVLGAARQILDNVTSRRAATGVTGGPSSRIGGSHGTLARGLIAVSAIRLFFPQLHEKAVQTIRLMGSSGLIITPTDRDFENPELEETIARYFKGSEKTARERIKIMRLAWDAISTEFGGRQLLYEFFFAGDPFNNRLLYFGTERNQECTALAQRILDS
jgi:4-hydroxyphenylacetate 3-monooxygenase/anthranilate 3-monooxygenase (FAD)/4-hydroxyphenylacetate 3-monooxygenase